MDDKILICILSMALGFALIFDGLVRVLTFGIVRPDIAFQLARFIAREDQ